MFADVVRALHAADALHVLVPAIQAAPAGAVPEVRLCDVGRLRGAHVVQHARVTPLMRRHGRHAPANTTPAASGRPQAKTCKFIWSYSFPRKSWRQMPPGWLKRGESSKAPLSPPTAQLPWPTAIRARALLQRASHAFANAGTSGQKTRALSLTSTGSPVVSSVSVPPSSPFKYCGRRAR